MVRGCVGLKKSYYLKALDDRKFDVLLKIGYMSLKKSM